MLLTIWAVLIPKSSHKSRYLSSVLMYLAYTYIQQLDASREFDDSNTLAECTKAVLYVLRHFMHGFHTKLMS